MNKLIVLVIIFICSACCTKKNCVFEDFPTIPVKFIDLPQNASGKIVVYTLKFNAIQDSVIYNETTTLTLYPYGEITEPNTFLIKWENKNANVTDVHSDLIEKKIKCNTCFPFGDGSQTVTVYESFSFQYNNQTYHKGDTLYLNW